MNFWKLLILVGACLFALLLTIIVLVHDPSGPGNSGGPNAPHAAPIIPIEH